MRFVTSSNCVKFISGNFFLREQKIWKTHPWFLPTFPQDYFRQECVFISCSLIQEYDFLNFRIEKFYMYFINFSKCSVASSEQELNKLNEKILINQEFVTQIDQVDLLRETLRKKLETTYKDIWDTPHAFQYLARCSCQYYGLYANTIVLMPILLCFCQPNYVNCFFAQV